MNTSMPIAPVKSTFTARGPINPPHPLPTLTTSYAFLCERRPSRANGKDKKNQYHGENTFG